MLKNHENPQQILPGEVDNKRLSGHQYCIFSLLFYNNANIVCLNDV
jgi:hypothetical protein